MKTEHIRLSKIEPLHSAGDRALVRQLAQSMQQEGWRGNPLLVIDLGYGYQALTGSHRLEAAREAGLDEVPAVVIDDPGHRVKGDGCETCGNDCRIIRLIEARDDYERADIVTEIYGEDYATLLLAEIDGE